MRECLDLTVGNFLTLNWSVDGAVHDDPNVRVIRSATSMIVERKDINNKKLFFPVDSKFIVFGSDGYVLVLGVTGTFIVNLTLTIVKTAAAASNNQELERQILFSVGQGDNDPLPAIAASPGKRSLFFVAVPGPTANTFSSLGVFRSDDGTPVLNGPNSLVNASGIPTAKLTADEVVILHPTSVGTNHDTTSPWPAGLLKGNGTAVKFADVVIAGTGSAPPPTTSTATFELQNSGDDCVTITGFTDAPPFTVTSATPGPISPGGNHNVKVKFSPTEAKDYQRQLVVHSPSGNVVLNAEGKGIEAKAILEVIPSPLNFGVVPAGAFPKKSFKVTNVGNLDADVSIPGPSANSPFTWTKPNQKELQPGEQLEVEVTFNVSGATSKLSEIILITGPPAESIEIMLQGQGCLPQGKLQVPAGAPIVFPIIERGFRMVRTLRLENSGNSEVGFEARIRPGANANLFGIQQIGEDITKAAASVTGSLLPTRRCGAGATGSGEQTIGIVFHASAPSNVDITATLEVIDLNNNQVTAYQLAGKVSDPIVVQAALVVDRSGSMANKIGDRTKLEAAKTAGLAFARMLRSGLPDQIAIISYGTEPTIDHGLVPMSQAAGGVASALNQIQSGGLTNIAGGLILADTELVDEQEPPDAKKVVVVLTDGMENRCFERTGSGEWFSLNGGTLPDETGTSRTSKHYSTPNGVTVYAIGLGNANQIDSDVLDLIAAGSGGYFANVTELTGADFFALEKYFTQIFMEAVGMSMISDPFYTIASGDKHRHEFDVMPGDMNTMVVLYDRNGKLPFYVETPSGEFIDGANVPPGFGLRFRSQGTVRFAEILFPPGEPERFTGRWSVTVVHDGVLWYGDTGHDRSGNPKESEEGTSRYLGTASPGFVPKDTEQVETPVFYGIAIGASSNLRMQVFVDPAPKSVGDPIRLNAVIAEAGIAVTDARVDVSVLTPRGGTYSMRLTDSGTSVDGKAGDGDYGAVFNQTYEVGTYTMVFTASGVRAGNPWSREVSRSKTVGDPRDSFSAGQPDSDCCERLVKLLSATTGQES